MHNQFSAIPAELRNLKQWLCWRYEDIGAKKPTKVPYNPNTGELANVNAPDTWCSFEDALRAFQNTKLGYSGLGFVFTSNDPYTFIDLDNTEGDTVAQQRQLNVYHEFDSYSEVSPSGKGLHIIIKGNVPQGRRRSFIEVYSSQRYATMTGNTYPSAKEAKPIVERQDLLLQLWEQMGSGTVAASVYKGDEKELYSDDEVIQKALAAVNGDKFKKLLDGSWNDLYQSQSEADFAFIDILAFYTQNRVQLARMFRKSLLGSRKKADRADYINGMVNKSFDRMLPPIDIEGFTIAVNKKLAEPMLPMNLPEVKKVIALPPGLLGEIAKFIYYAAPRPVPEIALAGAIGLMAGITGRAYNISGTGLNQYVMLIANTGSGKEAMALGIDKLMNTIKMQVPTSKDFIGPSEIASGQALVKHLGKRTVPCFLSILGEFGLRLQSMSNPNANSAEISLKRVLLDLYNKSGHGQHMQSSIYADADKNTSAVESPCFTILGESTPERFYGVLNEDMISEGLLPRFTLIEYTGPRPPLSGHHLTANPSIALVEQFATLVATCSQVMHAKKVMNVQSTDEASKLLVDFDTFCDNQINNSNKEILRQLWNRAHVKAMKIAALIAVGVNMYNPMIEVAHVEWAIEMVNNDIKALMTKFDSGNIGQSSSESKQQTEVINIVSEYLRKPFAEIKRYHASEMLHQAKVIPYAYINRRLIAATAFRTDRSGATPAIKRALQSLIDSGKLREVGRNDMAVKYGSTQRAFMVSDMGILD